MGNEYRLFVCCRWEDEKVKFWLILVFVGVHAWVGWIDPIPVNRTSWTSANDHARIFVWDRCCVFVFERKYRNSLDNKVLCSANIDRAFVDSGSIPRKNLEKFESPFGIVSWVGVGNWWSGSRVSVGCRVSVFLTRRNDCRSARDARTLFVWGGIRRFVESSRRPGIDCRAKWRSLWFLMGQLVRCPNALAVVPTGDKSDPNCCLDFDARSRKCPWPGPQNYRSDRLWAVGWVEVWPNPHCSRGVDRLWWRAPFSLAWRSTDPIDRSL